MGVFPRHQAAAYCGVNMEEPKLQQELEKMEHEPLLPVEKKLIIWSIGVGLGGSGLLMLLSELIR